MLNRTVVLESTFSVVDLTQVICSYYYKGNTVSQVIVG